MTFMSATDALGFFLCAFGLSFVADFMALDIDLKPTDGTPTRFFFCKTRNRVEEPINSGVQR